MRLHTPLMRSCACAGMGGAEWGMCWRAEISVCEPDFKVSVDAASATPNDPLYNQQWNMQAIKVPTVWSGGQFGDPNRQVCTSTYSDAAHNWGPEHFMGP